MTTGLYCIGEELNEELSLLNNGHLAVAIVVVVVSSHLIAPPSKREALVIKMLTIKFLVESSISVISKYTAEKPCGSAKVSAVSPTDATSWDPSGNITRMRATSFSSQVKRRESVGCTPPFAHCSFVKLAIADTPVILNTVYINSTLVFSTLYIL